LRRYFSLRGGRPATVAEALAVGEGQSIEFKHGLTEDPLLKAITAFANTNDGTVFIGIDDEGRVRGLEFPSPKAKDEFRHKVYGLVRDRIQPIPVVDLDFENSGGVEVARLFVRRGDAPLYYFRGVNYIRHGESNVTPRPEQVVRILEKYAF
jgi:ATP-dependent DNA helicase RecG